MHKLLILILVQLLCSLAVNSENSLSSHRLDKSFEQNLINKKTKLKDFKPSQQISGPVSSYNSYNNIIKPPGAVKFNYDTYSLNTETVTEQTNLINYNYNYSTDRRNDQENFVSSLNQENSYNHPGALSNNYDNHNLNQNNHAVTLRSTAKNQNFVHFKQDDVEQKTESTLNQGRIFGGGGISNGWSSSWNPGIGIGIGGGGGFHNKNQCQHLQSYNPGCCNLGYSNCCGGGGQHIPRPVVIGGSGWKGKSQVGLFPQPHQPHYRPRPRPPPIRPQPIIIPHRPQPHYGGHEKPGSCHYKSPFAFLSKFNIFNKHKGDIGLIKGGNSWGWNTPSQNAGYHFYKRSDRFKRQLDLSPENNKQYNEYAEDKNVYRIDERSNSNQFGSNYNNYGNKYEDSYPTGHYGPPTVGIGSITGRILGGWGWNSGITTGWTSVNPNHPCYSDYECPGNQKCCVGICKTPS